jgi:plasmid maintenance system antidote protein VapI
MRILIHPGEILGDALEEIGLTFGQLAATVGVKATWISQVTNRKRRIAADTAL